MIIDSGSSANVIDIVGGTKETTYSVYRREAQESCMPMEQQVYWKLLEHLQPNSV